jgi:hypothetical protein
VGGAESTVQTDESRTSDDGGEMVVAVAIDDDVGGDSDADADNRCESITMAATRPFSLVS